MSVETQPSTSLTPEVDSITARVEGMTPEAVQGCIDGILSATDDASAQQERFSYELIAKIFKAAYDEQLEAVHHQREQILDTFLENPARSVAAEFRQLKLLYRKRINKNEASNSTVASEEFCLQDHTTHSIDYLMQEISTPEGSSLIRISSHFDLGDQVETPVSIVCCGGELTAYAKVQQGREAKTRDVQLDERKTKMCLIQLFQDTIRASALQIERSDEECRRCDNEATRLLARLAS